MEQTITLQALIQMGAIIMGVKSFVVDWKWYFYYNTCIDRRFNYA